jgi:hypothetical protein
MVSRMRTKRLGALLPLLVACLVVAGCGGSSSGNAVKLLRETFSGSHKVNSGTLNVALTLTPSGSRTLKNPISIAFGGPFESRGTGKLPASNFTVTLGASSSAASIGLISTGTTGYVSFQGSSYQLPQADFQRLESSFSQLASSPGSSSNSGILGRLGIDPLRWLKNPSIVGTATVGGVQTTHIHSSINVSALLSDFSTFLQKASSLGISGSTSFPHGISPSTISRIAGEIQHPTFDVWTGNADKTIRRLRINLTFPVTGQISALLGGLRSAGVGLSMDYGALNQPQNITAPSSVKPYGEFQTKLAGFVGAIRSSIESAITGGASTGSGSSGFGTSTSSTTGSNYQKYSACIQRANGDVTKMQKCAPLLNGGG